MDPTGACFFGKLPGAGDFVQRRLPSPFVEAWDRHFERAVSESKVTLGDAWQHAYRSSPAWRFLLSPGVCTDAAWVGVMGPANDRVGRSFPMVIARHWDDMANVAHVLRDGDGWFAAIEHAHVSAQAAALGAEAFDAQLLALADMPMTAPAGTHVHGVEHIAWWNAVQWRLPLPRVRTDGAFLADLWARISASGNGWCLWWTQGGGHVPPSVLITRGLPQPSAYAGFLDARHADEGWQSLGVFEELPSPHHHSHPHHAAHVSVATHVATPSLSSSHPLLPDDLSELFADLVPPVSMAVASGATDESEPKANGSASTVYRGDVALAVVAADEGGHDPRRQAAAAANKIAHELDAEHLASGLQMLRQRLLALHPSLRERSEDLINPVPEDGSVIAVHITRRWANLLRIGTAAAWHWRGGSLQSLFATGAATTAEGDALGGEFDDLLFTRAAPVASGLGGPAEPLCDEVVCAVEEGDRLLLIVTQRLVQLPPDVYARALAMPSCDDARARIASAAGLGSEPASWPLAVIEVTS